MRTLWIAALSLTLAYPAFAQGSQPSKAAPSQTAKPPAPRITTDPARQLQADLEKMRLILRQMQTNLAFAQVGDTPMKHQFELEIDMWTVLINHMESELRQAQSSTSPPQQ